MIVNDIIDCSDNNKDDNINNKYKIMLIILIVKIILMMIILIIKMIIMMEI